MELAPGREQADAVAPVGLPGHLGHDRLELAELGLAAALGGQPRGQTLEHRPDRVDLVDVADAERAGVDAPPREGDDQPLALELADRLAHRDAADAERLREPGLEQPLSWLDL